MRQFHQPSQSLFYVFAISIVTIPHFAWVYANASAQTAPITSSGLNTQISAPIQVDGQTQYNITGGTRPGGGVNLFHSFGEFGVPNNNIANFHNDFPGLQTFNILGRVTGGSESHILGTIRTSEFGSANLFLMNPAGFLFGPNATVNVGGMVSFTSADYLKLEDGKQFNAIPNTTADALLSASPVAAFGFLGSNPGAIIVQGSEFNGASISLVGGNITIESGTPSGGTAQQAKLSAANGTIQLASATSPGAFDTTLQAISNVNGASFTTFGTVSLAPGSTINVSGTDTVSIRGGQFVLSVNEAMLHTTQSPGNHGTIVLDTQSTIVTEAFGTEMGGTITLKAEKSLALRGNSSITTRVEAGNGGPVSLTAPSIQLEESSNIGTATSGLGKAGNVELQGDRISLTLESFISTRTRAGGNGGDITIRGLTGEGSRASDILLSESSRLVSETIGDGVNNQGNAGNIHVEAARLHLSGSSHFNSTSRGSTGAAGNISVNATDSVILTGSGSQLVSDSAEFSSGDAGNISISAPSIIVENGGSISSNTTLTGKAGTITVNTNHLRLLSGGHITSGSLVDPSETPLSPSGAAGTVIIQGITPSTPAQSVLIGGTRSGIFTRTEGSGLGGTIMVTADQVQLVSGASITAHSTGAADAGNINITAANGLTVQDSSITTHVTPNDIGRNTRGGDITVTTSPAATVYLQNSTISASVPGNGDGGNISIDPKFVILQHSQILAKTDQGTGGNITITTSVFQPDASSVINADSDSGVNGTVTIQSPNAPASGKIQPLGNRPLQATSLLSQHCARVAGGEFSSFTVAGRDTLPTEPGGWLSIPSVLARSESDGSTTADTDLRASRDKLMGQSSILSLRHIAPPGFLTQTFARPGQSGCTS
ncbi:MAG: filamentous hemagglutinin N-terminal domain-containing protein [Nitrospirota bacterium]